MKLTHGHIYFIEFTPSSGHEFQKMRPAVIFSSDELIKRSNLISCVPLTSNTENMINKDDILVKKSNQNNLFKDSVLKSQHICTFDKRRVKKYIGELEQVSFGELKKVVARNFDIDSG
jgi:mRNA interferase MazF